MTERRRNDDGNVSKLKITCLEGLLSRALTNGSFFSRPMSKLFRLRVGFSEPIRCSLLVLENGSMSVLTSGSSVVALADESTSPVRHNIFKKKLFFLLLEALILASSLSKQFILL